MPAESHDKMYVETGQLDETAFSHTLTMSRTGRVRAKKQHLRMATYLQTQRDYENEERLDRQRKSGDFILTESRTLPRTPKNRGEIVSPYHMRKIPDVFQDAEEYNSDPEIKKKAGANVVPTTIKIQKPTSIPKTLQRSNSFEEKRRSNQYDRAEQNYKSMTLSRVPKKRVKDERPSFVSPTRRDKGSKLSGFLSPTKKDSSNSKFYLDVNDNDTSRKGNTLGRYRRKLHSPTPEDDSFRPRSSTFSTNGRPSKPFRQMKKSEADENANFTLEEMLKNKGATQAFRDFLKSEFSEENLDFWLDCEYYKSLKGSKQMKMAFRIFAHYLARSAPREVNIDSDIRTRTEENLKNPDKETFVEAQNCIYTLMKSDPFRRFIMSEKYSQLADDKGGFRKLKKSH